MNRDDPFLNQPHGFSNVAGGVQKVDDVELEAVEVALLFNILLFIGLMLFYEVVRRMLPSVYSSRTNTPTNSKSPVHIPPGFLSWIEPVTRTTWQQVRRAGGMDAYMYLRYLRMAFQIVAVGGIWGMVVLFPVFASGGGRAEGWYHLSMQNVVQGSWRLWMPAVFMWYLTFYVLYVMNEEFKHFVEMRRDYLSRSDEDINNQYHYTIMIENIPNELRSDKALYDYFSSLFPGKVHSANVVMNIPDLETLVKQRDRVVRRLEKSIAYFEATATRPTHVCGRYRFTCLGIESGAVIPYMGRRTNFDDDTIITDGEASPYGERVDSIAYYQKQLRSLNDKVANAQKAKKALARTGNEMVAGTQWMARTFEAATDAAVTRMGPAREDSMIISFGDSSGSVVETIKATFSFFFGGFLIFNRELDAVVDSAVGNANSSTGFVTFKDRFSVTCVNGAPLSSESDILDVTLAPEPRDVRWEVAHVGAILTKGREATANALLVVGVLLWSVPVAFIQAIATVETIATIPGMEWMHNLNGGPLASFVNGYLPVILLLGLINLLPIIFEWIATVYEDRKTHTDIQNSINARFFYYQLANIYITVTAASAWDSLAEIINHPSNALWILGRTLPTVVGYFISLLITKILAGLPIVMLRPTALLRMLFINIVFDERTLTQAEIDEVYKSQMLWYGYEYPSQLLVIVICFTYACISPIVMPVGALYFLMALLVYKKQVLVVYNPFFEGGGLMFPSVCHMTLMGLICGQITLTGYTVIRGGYAPAVLMTPLPFLTFTMSQVFKRMYSGPSAGLTLSVAKELDKQAGPSRASKFDKDVYRQPSLAVGAAGPQPYRRGRAQMYNAEDGEQGVSVVVGLKGSKRGAKVAVSSEESVNSSSKLV